MQYHVSCQNTCSLSISCPDKVWQDIFFPGIRKKSAYKSWKLGQILALHYAIWWKLLSHSPQRILKSLRVLLCHCTQWTALWLTSTQHASKYFSVVSDIWVPSTNQGSSDRAQKKSNLSSWICVGPVSHCWTSLVKPRQMGVGWVWVWLGAFWNPHPRAAKSLEGLVGVNAQNAAQECACAKRSGLFVQLDVNV